MNEVINDTHFKSFRHVRDAVKHHFPNAKDKEIRDVVASRLHDRLMKPHQKRVYYRKIFEPVPGCFFHDLLQQPRGEKPPYYHIFIGTNNRYAFAYPVNDKTAKTAVETLNKFIHDNEGKPLVKLTSDGECAFNSEQFINHCHEHGITLKIIPDKAHSTFGIVDRFMRTLRDMNQPANRSQDQQYDRNYIVFEPSKMTKLINSYNNTYHTTIKCSPRDMYENPAKEREYIMRCLKQRAIQNNIKGFHLNPGDYVRYRMNDEDLNGHKRRSQFSREKYVIKKRIGGRYLIQSADGKVLSKSRFELIKADDADPIGLTFEQNQRANPEAVLTGILYT